MLDLVFLLYELPPPLGKRSSKIDSEFTTDPDKQKSGGIRQQERYLINHEKKIVLKKRDALDLLSDLKIKVHADSVKQISFVDVFKALIKRVFVDKKIDYKLSPNLSKKIKTNWGKKHKVSNKEKMKYNAQEQQAGLIIVRWARKMLNGPKDHVKKSTTDKKQTTTKKNFPNDKDKKRSKDKTTITDIYKQQAQTIYNIITNAPEKEGERNRLNDNKYKIKNEYSWKKQGGQQLLDKLYDDGSSSDNAFESDSNSERVLPDKIFKKLDEIEENAEFEDEFSDNLFGPKAQEALKKQAQKKYENMLDDLPSKVPD